MCTTARHSSLLHTTWTHSTPAMFTKILFIHTSICRKFFQTISILQILPLEISQNFSSFHDGQMLFVPPPNLILSIWSPQKPLRTPSTCYSLSGQYMHRRPQHETSCHPAFCSNILFIWFVLFSQPATDIISLQNIKSLVFIMRLRSVFCEVWRIYIYIYIIMYS